MPFQKSPQKRCYCAVSLLLAGLEPLQEAIVGPIVYTLYQPPLVAQTGVDAALAHPAAADRILALTGTDKSTRNLSNRRTRERLRAHTRALAERV